MTNLTEHFTLEEFIYSDTAKTYKIDNTPTVIHLKTIKHTCQYLLEPLRKLLGKPIKITSGYRGKKLNTKVGGAKNSQHTQGEAVDISVSGINYQDLYNKIKQFVKEGKLSVDQLIEEKSGNTTWIHVSYKAGGASVNRKQFLKYNNGKYQLDK